MAIHENKSTETSILAPAVRPRRRDMRGTLLGGALVFLGVGTGFSLANIQRAFHEMDSMASTTTLIQPAPTHCQSISIKRGGIPFLGIEYQKLTTGNAQVQRVFPNSPASRIGLSAGDIVVAVNDDSLIDHQLGGGLQGLIRRHHIGEQIVLTTIDADSGEERVYTTKLGNSRKILNRRHSR